MILMALDECATSGLPSGGWGALLWSPRVVDPRLESVIPLGWPWVEFLTAVDPEQEFNASSGWLWVGGLDVTHRRSAVVVYTQRESELSKVEFLGARFESEGLR